jgi:predicted SAM-dependent methyltransferase
MRRLITSAGRRLLLSFLSQRTATVLRYDLYFLRVRTGNALLRRRARIRADLARRGSPLFLNLGSGALGLADPRWLNVDARPDQNVAYLLDFTKGWPLPDSRFDGIFCEHVFEHFDPAEGAHVLRECFRVLKAGGGLRVVVPDGETILKSYAADPASLLEHRTTETGCAMEAVNSFFRQEYEHQCIYDFQYLEYRLREAGFERIAKVAFGEGALREIILDDAGYAWESLYVEAFKPRRSESDAGR